MEDGGGIEPTYCFTSRCLASTLPTLGVPSMVRAERVELSISASQKPRVTINTSPSYFIMVPLTRFELASDDLEGHYLSIRLQRYIWRMRWDSNSQRFDPHTVFKTGCLPADYASKNAKDIIISLHTILKIIFEKFDLRLIINYQ